MKHYQLNQRISTAKLLKINSWFKFVYKRPGKQFEHVSINFVCTIFTNRIHIHGYIESVNVQYVFR